MSLKDFKESSANKVEMNLVITKEAFENAVNKVFRKTQKNISIPGFRKGKATRGLIEKFYGKEVFYEDAINELLPEEIKTAVKETPYKIAGTPEVDDVDFEAEDGIDVKVSFVRYPDVKVEKYKELEVEKVIVKADKSELDEELERTRARYARTVKVTDRAAAKDDTVDIDYEGFCDGKAFDGGKAEGHKLKLGSNTFIPGFEDQIIGKNIGESFDVNVTFPKEYHASELAGKEAVFKCKLNGIEFEELPELDDEFAKDASEFDTLDEYKKDIKAKIQQRHDAEAEVRFAEELTKKLTDNVKADIPDVLIEKEKDNLLREYDYQLRSQGLSLDVLMKYTGMKLEDIRARYADMALINVKKQLALDEIVKLEKIEASDKEVEDKYGEMAKEFGMKVEDVKSRITAEDLAYDVQSIKAFELVKNSAKVDEKKVTLKEFEEMNSQTKTEKAEKEKKEPAKAKKETAKEPKEQKEPKEPAKEKKTASKAKKEEVKEEKTAKPAKKTTKKAE
ncbi:MAG: trigger factor [Clostridia bacterium]|nr:trigger factor [Clostridia bacterium]